MTKVIYKPIDYNYTEETQPNPLLWTILKKEKDHYVTQSGQMKCKDYFNDVVYKLNTGTDVTLYGFNTSSLVLNPDKSLSLLLINITPNFTDNVNKVINPWLTKNGWPELVLEGAEAVDRVIVHLDPFYTKNTYNVSLITLIIRLCNQSITFDSWEAFSKYNYSYKDKYLWDKAVKKNMYFNLPDKVKGYIWYSGPEHNDKTVTESYRIPIYVHNCGFVGWMKAL